MELTRQADYAIRCVLETASHQRVSTAELARLQDIPLSYLGKIVGALARAGILQTRRGAGGGVALARPPDTISVLQVIEAVQGPIRVNLCTASPPACERAERCPVCPVCHRAQEALAAAFSVSFGELLAEGERRGDGDEAADAATRRAEPVLASPVIPIRGHRTLPVGSRRS